MRHTMIMFSRRTTLKRMKPYVSARPVTGCSESETHAMKGNSPSSEPWVGLGLGLGFGLGLG